MIHSRIGTTNLRDRLDASYYSPDVLANEAALIARGSITMRQLIDVDRSNYGVLPPSDDYLPVGSGVPLIRGGDLDNGDIRTPEVDAPIHFRNARGTTNLGDVLLLIKGACIDSPAGVALVSKRHAGSVFNGSCYRLTPLPGCDAGYIVAYCQTRFLLLQKRREIANTGIAYNAEDSVLGYLVPKLALEAQRYIGDKVRQAARLRERAQRLEGAARRALSQLVLSRREAASSVANLRAVLDGAGSTTATHESQPGRRDIVLRSRVSPDLLLGRLNAEAYQEEFLENDRVLRSSGWALKSLAALVSAPINNSIRGVTENLTGNRQGVPMFRPADIDGLWMNCASAPRIDALFEQEHAKARVLPGDIVLAIAGTVASVGRIGEEVSHGNINGSSARIRFEEPLRGFALFFLESPYGRRSLMRVAVGSVQKHLNLEDLADVKMPVPDPAHCAPFERALVLSGRARRYATALLTVATQLVEGLVTGAVPESTLVVAARATDADAALLRQLKDPNSGRLLFPDIDALCEVLTEENVDVGGEG